MKSVIGKCLACGNECDESRVYTGVVGPFCSPKCRDGHQDLRVWQRAAGYAANVVDGCRREPLQSAGEVVRAVYESDIARAFVIGYAAGLEDGHNAVGRRTVRK